MYLGGRDHYFPGVTFQASWGGWRGGLAVTQPNRSGGGPRWGVWTSISETMVYMFELPLPGKVHYVYATNQTRLQ